MTLAKKHVLHVVGARPNYMKIAPVMREMSQHPEKWRQTLVHTGQHYDHRMSQVFFDDLGMLRPDVYLDVGSGSHAEQYARVLQAFEPVLREHRPDWVVVAGDVNSTLACALSAAQMHIPVAHVEAGLRSFDRAMPEEVNRVLTDHLAELLFTTEASGNRNLASEGIRPEKIRFVGNTMIDTLLALLPQTDDGKILAEMNLWASASGSRNGSSKKPRPYALVTLHRPQNVDNSLAFTEIITALAKIAEIVPVLFPVHPRTRKKIEENELSIHPNRIDLLEPLGYLDFLTLMRHASFVVTDSGGIQEETTFLGVPCITIRPNTERPVTVELGTNRLVKREKSEILRAAEEALSTGRRKQYSIPEFWDGHAAQRIATYLDLF